MQGVKWTPKLAGGWVVERSTATNIGGAVDGDGAAFALKTLLLTGGRLYLGHVMLYFLRLYHAVLAVHRRVLAHGGQVSLRQPTCGKSLLTWENQIHRLVPNGRVIQSDA